MENRKPVLTKAVPHLSLERWATASVWLVLAPVAALVLVVALAFAGDALPEWSSSDAGLLLSAALAWLLLAVLGAGSVAWLAGVAAAVTVLKRAGIGPQISTAQRKAWAALAVAGLQLMVLCWLLFRTAQDFS